MVVKEEKMENERHSLTQDFGFCPGTHVQNNYVLG